MCVDYVSHVWLCIVLSALIRLTASVVLGSDEFSDAMYDSFFFEFGNAFVGHASFLLQCKFCLGHGDLFVVVRFLQVDVVVFFHFFPAGSERDDECFGYFRHIFVDGDAM